MLLEGAEELGLERRRQLTDLVEEARPPVGGLEEPAPRGQGARERAALMAEQLRLHERLGQRRAVHDHERPVGARARVVDGPGDQLLPRPRLALDEHGGVEVRHASHELVQLDHPGGLADEVLHAVALAELLPVLPVLAGEPLGLERAPHHEPDLFHPERLGEVVVGAGADRLDRGLDGREGGEDEHGHAVLDNGHPLEHAHPVQVGHPEVDEGEVEGLPFGELDALLAAGGGPDPVAFPAEHLDEQVARDRVVVGDEERGRRHRRHRRHRATDTASGRTTRNVLPRPGSLATSIRP